MVTSLLPVAQFLIQVVCFLSVPYFCAQGDPVQQAGPCAFNPENIDINELVTATNRFESFGEIDATANMYNSRVFILNGLLDTTVNPGRLLQIGIEVDLSNTESSNTGKIRSETRWMVLRNGINLGNNRW